MSDGVLEDRLSPPPAALPPEPGDPSLVRRLPTPLRLALTGAGFAAPTALYLWLVAAYTVNTIVSDQWNDVTVIRRTSHHLLNFSALWAQHNENRMFFPNLIVVLLARTTHFDITAEEWLSAGLLLAAVALLLWGVRRRSPRVPWLALVPVALLALSVVQYQNTLWGFQMAWYLIFLCLMVALVLLDRPQLSWVGFAGAVAAAVVGSFSSLQGLLIWPAGLVLLYHRRRRPAHLALWLGAMVVAAVVYLRNFRLTSGSPHSHYVLHHPLSGLEFFFALVGDVVGRRVAYQDTHTSPWVVLFGVVIVALAVTVALRTGLRRRPAGVAPLGVALIVYGLLFAAVVTIGRAYFHYWGATQSRYTTFDLLIPIGTVLCLLQPAALRRPAPAGPAGRWWARHPRRCWPAWTWPAAAAAVAGVVVVQLAVGTPDGLQGARANHTYQLQATRVLLHLDQVPDNMAIFYLYPFRSASFIRAQAATARQMHLSVFAGTSGSASAGTGAPPGAP